jgi:hypothetical protein
LSLSSQVRVMESPAFTCFSLLPNMLACMTILL